MILFFTDDDGFDSSFRAILYTQSAHNFVAVARCNYHWIFSREGGGVTQKHFIHKIIKFQVILGKDSTATKGGKSCTRMWWQ